MLQPREVNYEDYAKLYKAKFNALLDEHTTLEARYNVAVEYINQLQKEIEKLQK